MLNRKAKLIIIALIVILFFPFSNVIAAATTSSNKSIVVAPGTDNTLNIIGKSKLVTNKISADVPSTSDTRENGKATQADTPIITRLKLINKSENNGAEEFDTLDVPDKTKSDYRVRFGFNLTVNATITFKLILKEGSKDGPEVGTYEEDVPTAPGNGKTQGLSIDNFKDKLQLGKKYYITGEMLSSSVSDTKHSFYDELRIVPEGGGAFNAAPVLDGLTDDSGMSKGTITEGTGQENYPMKFKYHDEDSKTVGGTYHITSGSVTGSEVATGAITDQTNSTPGTTPVDGKFDIAGTDLDKLKAGTKYFVTLDVTDDGKASDTDHKYSYELDVDAPAPTAALEVPIDLNFTEVALGSQRQLDTREADWSGVKITGKGDLKVTVQQTQSWASDEQGNSDTLSPIEMVTSDDQFSSLKGNPINDAAVPVAFKTDGTLDWNNSTGLFQPVEAVDKKGSYSTELTWTSVLAPQ